MVRALFVFVALFACFVFVDHVVRLFRELFRFLSRCCCSPVSSPLSFFCRAACLFHVKQAIRRRYKEHFKLDADVGERFLKKTWKALTELSQAQVGDFWATWYDDWKPRLLNTKKCADMDAKTKARLLVFVGGFALVFEVCTLSLASWFGFSHALLCRFVVS